MAELTPSQPSNTYIHGKGEVEQFLDAVLAIQEHIDPSIVRPKLFAQEDVEEDEVTPPRTPYDDLWKLDGKGKAEEPTRQKKKQFPPQPEKENGKRRD